MAGIRDLVSHAALAYRCGALPVDGRKERAVRMVRCSAEACGMTAPVIPSESDLALTEQAAHAAGFEVRRYHARDLEVIHVREPGSNWRHYDPLNDDGEAFRLMVILCLAGFVYGMESRAYGAPSLRRAIVTRAAAEASITMGED